MRGNMDYAAVGREIQGEKIWVPVFTGTTEKKGFLAKLEMTDLIERVRAVE